MCFSAEISFSAGVALVGVGAYALKKVDSKKKIAFASVPVFFGLQQISEGFLWVSLNNGDQPLMMDISMYIYIFFAQVFWPTWIPLAIWNMEPDLKRKKILFYPFIIGILASLQLIYSLIFYDVEASASQNHIHYDIEIQRLGIHQVLYVISTAIPFYVSSLKYMKLVGTILVGSLIVAMIFYFYHVISIWCFFAAILSSLVILVDAKNQKKVSS